MIAIPSGRVWIATGHTDMRCGMQSLALKIQESFKRNPFAGDLYIFRGRRGDLVKILWHDGLGLSLYAKRLDRGKFIWPSASGGCCRSRRRRCRICSPESIGEILNLHGVRKVQGEQKTSLQQHFLHHKRCEL